MQLTRPKSIGKLSMMLVILIALVAGGASTLSQLVGAHADEITNMPASFAEDVGSGSAYSWKYEGGAYSALENKNLGNLNSGTWDVQEGSTDLGTVNTNVIVNNDPTSGVTSYTVNTTSTIPGIASLLSGSSTEAIPETGPNDYRSVFGQGAMADTDTAGNPAWEIDTNEGQTGNVDLSTGDSTLGPEMFHNMANLTTQEEQNYIDAEDVYQAQSDTGNGTFAMASSRFQPLSFQQPTHPGFVWALPASVVLLAAAGFLLTVGGGVITSVCGHGKCGNNSTTWAIVGGIMAAIGTGCLIVSGASISGWLIASRAATAAAGGALAAEATGVEMASGTVAAAAAETSIVSDLFPEIAIVPLD